MERGSGESSINSATVSSLDYKVTALTVALMGYDNFNSVSGDEVWIYIPVANEAYSAVASATAVRQTPLVEANVYEHDPDSACSSFCSSNTWSAFNYEVGTGFDPDILKLEL